MYENPFMPCKPLQTKIPTIVSRICAFLIRDPFKASIIEAWAMPKLGTLDYLCEVGVRINVMPNTRM